MVRNILMQIHTNKLSDDFGRKGWSTSSGHAFTLFQQIMPDFVMSIESVWSNVVIGTKFTSSKTFSHISHRQ